MKNPRRLKVREYAACLVDLNELLASFPGTKLTDNIGMVELNGILLNSMPNSWSKQAYVQVFTANILLLKRLLMCLNPQIFLILFQKVQQNLLTNTTRQDFNRDGHRRLNREEAALSYTYSEMSESAVQHRKIYVDYPRGNSKPTCFIHVLGHSSDECKVLLDFGSKYDKSRPTKDRGQGHANRNKFNIYQGNNAIVNSEVDEILLHENQKVSAKKQANENI